MKVHSPPSLGPLLTVLDTICSSHSLRLCFHPETVHKTYEIALIFFPLPIWMQSGIVLPAVSSLTLHTMSSSTWRRYTTYSSQVDTGLTWVRRTLVTDQLSRYISLLDFAGPLLYHFADMPGEFSIELSWEDIRRIAEQEIGFEILVNYLGFYYIIMAVNCLPRMWFQILKVYIQLLLFVTVLFQPNEGLTPIHI